MADRAIPACTLLREELRALAAPRRLRLEFAATTCPCRAAPGLPAHRLVPGEGRPEALLCAGALPGGPPTCFHLVAGEALVDRLLTSGAHLVTPGWLRQWPEQLQAMGLDGAGARALYGEAARRVVLLDTGAGPDAGPALEAFARHVGLPCERVEVGLDQLRLRVELAALAQRAARAEQRAADEAALLDALAGVEPQEGEAAVVASFVALLQLLLAPARLAWLPVVDGVPGQPVIHGEGDHEPLCRALQAVGAGEPPAPEGGLLLRVGPPRAELGWLWCEAVQFPEHLDRYRELAPVLARGCALSISRARAMEALARSERELRRHQEELDRLVTERTADLRRTVAEREAALEKARLLSGLIPICFGCKKIRDDEGYWTQLEVYISQHSDATFSHGLCEECLRRLYPDAG